jgi:GNAT superfamily N-acetyltransferase
MKLKPFTPEDLPILDSLQPEGWRSIRKPFLLYLDKPFCFPMKAVVNDSPVGTGAAIVLGDKAWLAHIIVSAPMRRKGVGSFIVDSLLSFLTKERNCTAVSLIATDLGHPVYVRAGFKDQMEYTFYEIPEEKHPSEIVTPDTTPAGVRPFSPDDTGAVSSLFKEIYGEDRYELVRDSLPRAFVFDSNSRIQACYLPGVGEGVILAEHEKAGTALLETKRALQQRFVVPTANSRGRELISAFGGKEIRRAMRMVYGTPYPWQPEAIYSRFGGNFG